MESSSTPAVDPGKAEGPLPAAPAGSPSIVRGAPLGDEPGLGPLTLPGYLRAITDRYAAREALVLCGAHGTDRWSYADLWARSMEVARALVAAGLPKDGRVGILLSNRPEYLSALFGTALAGGVAVALSTFSTPAELDHLLRASAVSILLVERKVVKRDFVETMVALEPRAGSALSGAFASDTYPFLSRLVVLESVSADEPGEAVFPGSFEPWADFLASGANVPEARIEARAAAVSPADVGVLFFSSGTTSLPKGILHAHRALCVQWWRWPRIMDIDAEKFPVRCWTGNGFFWSGNLSMMIGLGLSSGGAMVIQPSFQAEAALAMMEAERVSFPLGRPHQWARLAECPRWAGADLSSLHYVTYGDTLFAHPTVNTDWKTSVAFGTTETLTINVATSANTTEERRAGSYGWPLPGNTLKIFDPLTGAIVPRGTRGELAIKGPTLMIGYVGKTLDETFDDEGYFHTGDGGYVDLQGRVFWEGRLTDIIKTGGANVSPVEVDLAIARFAGVKRVQTVGVPDDMLGEIVVSCIVPHDGLTLDTAAIHAFLREQLASFKCPRAILFFAEDELSVTGSEKIKTAALRDLAAARLASGAKAAA